MPITESNAIAKVGFIWPFTHQSKPAFSHKEANAPKSLHRQVRALHWNKTSTKQVADFARICSDRLRFDFIYPNCRSPSILFFPSQRRGNISRRPSFMTNIRDARIAENQYRGSKKQIRA